MDAESLDKYEGLANAERQAQKQARRQAIYSERLNTKEGTELTKRVANRYLRNTQKGRTLLSAGQKPTTPHLSNVDHLTLMTVAGFFDFASFLTNLALPTIGGAVSDVLFTIPGSLIFYFMYKKRGVDFRSMKVTGRFLGSMAIEFIPVVNALPAFMMSVALMKKALNKEKGMLEM